ncbi:uncharacterized protein LOC111122928 [Crassostrea virginica]|uniref:Uncharacterized protein LOC111122928 n=1 Tax=Crassostrea virginica TaxID=6565 RepID=A0A8B8D1L5_CRAVI|nr:uncharacterized protein LOC111122928 [Crassostrea virginica]
MFTGGARPKEHKDSQSVDNRSLLPVELRNNFYADIVLIFSKDDSEEAARFLSQIQHFTEEHGYRVTGYLDNRLKVNDQTDYQRCSAFIYLFTQKSVQEYSKLTSDKILQSLMYDERMIAVLTEAGLTLPMSARVTRSLRYLRHQLPDWRDSLLDFLKKNAEIRKSKERSHMKKEKEYINRISPTQETEERPIIKTIYAENVIVGNHSKIEINRVSKNDIEAASVSQGIQTDIRSNQGRRLSSENLVKAEQNVRSSTCSPMESVTTPYASMSSYPPPNQRILRNIPFSNNTSIPDEDVVPNTGGYVSDTPVKVTLSSRTHAGPSSKERKSSLTPRNENPVPVRLPAGDLTFNNTLSLGDVTHKEAAYDMGKTIATTNPTYPIPKQLSCELISFSNWSLCESNTPLSSQQTEDVHVDREASLHHVQEDSLALQGESLNLDSLLEDSS